MEIFVAFQKIVLRFIVMVVVAVSLDLVHLLIALSALTVQSHCNHQTMSSVLFVQDVFPLLLFSILILGLLVFAELMAHIRLSFDHPALLPHILSHEIFFHLFLGMNALLICCVPFVSNLSLKMILQLLSLAVLLVTLSPKLTPLQDLFSQESISMLVVALQLCNTILGYIVVISLPVFVSFAIWRMRRHNGTKNLLMLFLHRLTCFVQKNV